MRYRSAFEASVAADLSERQVAFEYETERLPYEVPHVYIPDFIVTTRPGRRIFVEVKGHLTAEDKRKLLAVRRAHRRLDLRLVFQVASYRRKRGTHPNAAWARRHGFKWAESTVPQEWLDE